MPSKWTPEQIAVFKPELDRFSHPAAKPFPIIKDKEFDAFVADIDARGQLEAIVADMQGLIVDGRTRWLACKLLGKEPKIEQRDFTGAGAIEFVISKNIRRRHQNAGQRAMIMTELMKLAADEPENFPVLTQQAAAEEADVSDHTLRDARHLAEQVPEIAAEVMKGTLTLNAGKTLAKLPKSEERTQALAKAKAGDKKGAKALVKAARASAEPKKVAPAHKPGRPTDYADLYAELDALPGYLKNHPLHPDYAAELIVQLRHAIECIQQATKDLDGANEDDAA